MGNGGGGRPPPPVQPGAGGPQTPPPALLWGGAGRGDCLLQGRWPLNSGSVAELSPPVSLTTAAESASLKAPVPRVLLPRPKLLRGPQVLEAAFQSVDFALLGGPPLRTQGRSGHGGLPSRLGASWAGRPGPHLQGLPRPDSSLVPSDGRTGRRCAEAGSTRPADSHAGPPHRLGARITPGFGVLGHGEGCLRGETLPS